MQNIETIVAQNRFACDNLFRSYKVRGATDLEKIHDGYKNHGDTFMMRFLSIVTPKGQESKFTPTTLETKLPEPYIAPLVTNTGVSSKASTAAPGKGWTFWEKFLGALSSTGKTVGGVISDIKTPIATSDPTVVQQQIQTAARDSQTNKILYVSAAVFVAIILIILITKK